MNTDLVETKPRNISPIEKSQGLMPADWVRWVDENIARGCTPESIINILVENNYDKNYVTRFVFGKLGKDKPLVIDLPTNLFVDSDQEYEYEVIGPKLNGPVVKTTDREINVLLTVNQPRIILFDNVLSKDECEQMIALSKPKMKTSTTVNILSGESELHKNRTSSGTFFQLNETAFIARIDRRVSELMQVPIINGEGLQILNYQKGGEYKPHFDYFPPEKTGSKVHIARGGQRIATLILYLNNVEEGGETIFPKINLNVTPRQGSALYFAYTNSKNQVDPLTLHGGCPVLSGEKWIATKWVRQNQYK
jgi:prolyl 4-hydroxylase